MFYWIDRFPTDQFSNKLEPLDRYQNVSQPKLFQSIYPWDSIYYPPSSISASAPGILKCFWPSLITCAGKLIRHVQLETLLPNISALSFWHLPKFRFLDIQSTSVRIPRQDLILSSSFSLSSVTPYHYNHSTAIDERVDIPRVFGVEEETAWLTKWNARFFARLDVHYLRFSLINSLLRSSIWL